MGGGKKTKMEGTADKQNKTVEGKKEKNFEKDMNSAGEGGGTRKGISKIEMERNR